ncbi:hypothetical protein CIW69_11335 [Enterobacter cloacae]|jgi:hypothetical protein|nr:hypothetical protein CIW69_11335 [Enterobacter cloacae]
MYNNKEMKSVKRFNKYLAAIIFLIFVFASYFLIHASTKKTLLLKCFGNAVTIRHDSNLIESKLTITSGIFLYSNGEGILTQIGTIDVGETKYKIDRTHSIIYSDSDGDGVYTMEIQNMIKRAADNFPDNITVPYNLLRNSSVPLYVSITKPNEGLYLFKESDTPLFLCKQS